MGLTHLLALALGIGFFAFVLVSILLTASKQVEVSHQGRVTGWRFFGTALSFIPMAFIEEFFFRWVLIGQFQRIVGLIPAFLISIVAFVLAHRPNGRLGFLTVLNLSLVSVVLGFAFLRWGLWVVTAGHAGWNIAEWGMGYAVSGEKTRALFPSPLRRDVKGEPFGPEGHWTTSVVLLVMLAILINLHRPAGWL